MPYTPNTTWVDGSGGGTPITAARLNNMEPAAFGTYFAYTPAITGVSGGGAIGNGTIVGRYVQIGDVVHVYGSLTGGTTTNWGTNTMQISLPVTPAVTAAPLGIVRASDASTGNFRQVWAFASGAVFQMYYDSTHGGPLAAVDNSSGQPWAWAVSDILAWNLTYEAA